MKENLGDGSKPSQIQENASTTHPILPNNNQIDSSNLVPNPPNQPTLDIQSNESSNGGLPQMQRETNNEQKMNETLVEDSNNNNPPHANSSISSLDLQVGISIHNETESLNEDSNGSNQVILVDSPSDEASNDNLPISRFCSRRKLYICRYCNKGFSSKQALGGHQNGHKMEREGLPRSRVRNNSITTSPTNNIPLFNYPSNTPPFNPPHPYHYPYPSYYPGNVPYPYNPPFNGPIGFKTRPIIQRPSIIGGPSSSYNFPHTNTMWYNPFLITHPPLPSFNQMMNEPIFEYRKPWLGSSDPSLRSVFGSTSRTHGAGSSSTHNKTIREASRQERFVQQRDGEDDQEKDEFGLDLTLKL